MPIDPIRAFFAIELPISTLHQIESEICGLKKSIPNKIKWVNVRSMHITLKFIGEFELKHKKLIKKDLQKNIYGLGEIEISFKKIRAFPNLRNPRVVWMGINSPSQLLRLACTVDFIARNYGYPREKRDFSPHLTIGRIRKAIPKKEREIIGQSIGNYRNTEVDPCTIDKLSFIKSILTPKGPIYSTLFEIPF